MSRLCKGMHGAVVNKTRESHRSWHKNGSVHTMRCARERIEWELTRCYKQLVGILKTCSECVVASINIWKSLTKINKSNTSGRFFGVTISRALSLHTARINKWKIPNSKTLASMLKVHHSKSTFVRFWTVELQVKLDLIDNRNSLSENSHRPSNFTFEWLFNFWYTTQISQWPSSHEVYEKKCWSVGKAMTVSRAN